jgi:hypothetical protein
MENMNTSDTDFEPECGNAGKISKKARQVEVDSWFCDMCQQDSSGDITGYTTCSEWFHDSCTRVRRTQSASFVCYVHWKKILSALSWTTT